MIKLRSYAFHSLLHGDIDCEHEVVADRLVLVSKGGLQEFEHRGQTTSDYFR